MSYIDNKTLSDRFISEFNELIRKITHLIPLQDVAGDFRAVIYRRLRNEPDMFNT